MSSNPSSSIPTSTDTLWQQLTLPPASRMEVQPFPIDPASAAPIDKHATMIRVLAQEATANLKTFCDTADDLKKSAEDTRREMEGAKTVFKTEHERVVKEIVDLAERSQNHIISVVREQTGTLPGLQTNLELQFEFLKAKIDTLNTTCQLQATALQNLQGQQTFVVDKLAALTPRLEALFSHVDNARLQLEKTVQDRIADAQSEARRSADDLRAELARLRSRTSVSPGTSAPAHPEFQDLPPSSAPPNESSPRRSSTANNSSNKRRRTEPDLEGPAGPRPESPSHPDEAVLPFSSFPLAHLPITTAPHDRETTPPSHPQHSPPASYTLRPAPALSPTAPETRSDPTHSSSSPVPPVGNRTPLLSAGRLGSHVSPSTDRENEYSLPRGRPLRPLNPLPVVKIREAQLKPARAPSPLSARGFGPAPTPRTRPFAPSTIGNQPLARSPTLLVAPPVSSSARRASHQTPTRRGSLRPVLSTAPESPPAVPASPVSSLSSLASSPRTPAVQPNTENATPTARGSVPPWPHQARPPPTGAPSRQPTIAVLSPVPSSGGQRQLTLQERRAASAVQPRRALSFGSDDDDEEDELVDGGSGPVGGGTGGTEVPWFEGS